MFSCKNNIKMTSSNFQTLIGCNLKPIHFLNCMHLTFLIGVKTEYILQHIKILRNLTEIQFS